MLQAIQRRLSRPPPGWSCVRYKTSWRGGDEQHQSPHNVPHNRPIAPFPLPKLPNIEWEEPSEQDRRIVEMKHLGHPCGQMIGVGSRCRWNHPQVLVFAPLTEVMDSDKKVKQIRADHGLFRLSCPMLQREVKKIERAGSLQKAQERMENDEKMKAQLEAAHHSVPALRSHLIPQDWVEKLKSANPEDLEAVNLTPKAPMILFETGLIGVSLNKAAEVKCFHAHLADYLMRGKVNPIGPLVIEHLADQGVDVKGTDECWKECQM
mmetsp:Transcript_20295/g.34023  ORF Transcript_20295/g.34023 Transcript_20295/m.34023 type:complete len:264 (+) Transcript_20295:120-911(+)